MVNTRSGAGIDLPNAYDRISLPSNDEWTTPEGSYQGEDLPTPKMNTRQCIETRDNDTLIEPTMSDKVNEETYPGETPSRAPRTEGPTELDKQLELARIQLEIARLQRAAKMQPTQAAKLGTSKAFKAYIQHEYNPKSEVG